MSDPIEEQIHKKMMEEYNRTGDSIAFYEEFKPDPIEIRIPKGNECGKIENDTHIHVSRVCPFFDEFHSICNAYLEYYESKDSDNRRGYILGSNYEGGIRTVLKCPACLHQVPVRIVHEEE